ncbi:MAG: 50S ribosomal protein L17 [Verrucomicrobia bacterium]|nr:50S ribosomal protein L17 [Verrucomicrobiota bacterium]MCG2678987.1 50S ribosomal protein L17 [Kiritimatiellia bacterium]MBU4248339.1 50S ribosomal protein L17 [Verrucomicrobiota bacterium]MBU4289724.1 50S ribosomal protein L17 [Verrucomicrobiota bacterium]MBU4428562.1 50S ribosomal protein L17 [Verrucomicrobiota bacterium]
MRHRMVSSTFGRSTAHRTAMMANLVCSLIFEKRITTTLTKAKAMRSLAEKMVTLAKRGTLATRRRAVSVLRRKDIVKILFAEIAPQCQDRAGGYTRIIKLARYRSDGAALAIVEWVNIRAVDKKKKPVVKDEKKDKPAVAG